jgi:hypothetical protein
MRARNGRDGGQATPLVVMVLLVAVLGCLVVARVGRVANLDARARTAADASALAGAGDGEAAATAVASANGAALVAYRSQVHTVTVTVALLAVHDIRATATASVDSSTFDPGRGGGLSGDLSPALRAALDRAGQLLGHPVEVAGSAGPNEILVPVAAAPAVVAVSRFSGLCIVSVVVNPVHFGVCPPRTSHLDRA